MVLHCNGSCHTSLDERRQCVIGHKLRLLLLFTKNFPKDLFSDQSFSDLVTLIERHGFHLHLYSLTTFKYMAAVRLPQ
jgi:hypothetical protein